MNGVILSEQEMVVYLTHMFPKADFSMLGSAGLKEAVRIADALNGMGVLLQLDFALVASYALAFQRWMEAAVEVKQLSTPYVTGANSFMQTHPAMQNEQKYFSIMRSSIRHILQEVNERFADKDDTKKDDLEEYLKQKETKE